MKSHLKLFVWKNFSPDYSGGLAVAIAKDEAEAMKQVTAARGYNVYDWGTLTIHRLDRCMAASVSGGG